MKNVWLTPIQQKVRKYLERKTGRCLFSEKELQRTERKIKDKKGLTLCQKLN